MTTTTQTQEPEFGLKSPLTYSFFSDETQLVYGQGYDNRSQVPKIKYVPLTSLQQIVDTAFPANLFYQELEDGNAKARRTLTGGLKLTCTGPEDISQTYSREAWGEIRAALEEDPR